MMPRRRLARLDELIIRPVLIRLVIEPRSAALRIMALLVRSRVAAAAIARVFQCWVAETRRVELPARETFSSPIDVEIGITPALMRRESLPAPPSTVMLEMRERGTEKVGAPPAATFS